MAIFNSVKKNQDPVILSLTSWDNSAKSVYIRLTLVAIAFIFCFFSLGYRMIYVALADELDKKTYYSSKNIIRREIVDRNGNLLALNIPASSVFANPQHMINIKESVEKLSKVVSGIDKEKLIAELNGNQKTFVWIKRDLTPQEHQNIHSLGITGLYFENEERRLYTYGSIASHLLGYVSRDGKGLAGLEKSYDNFLNNNSLPKSSDESTPLALTIDIRLQNIVSEELDKVMEKSRASGGAAIVVDPNTGEILALVSKPDFDPHNPSKASDDKLFNRASLGIYELGSIMKCITLAVGFDSKKVTLHDAYNLDHFRVGKFQVKDFNKSEGWNSVADLFRQSSNIGATQIVLEIGQDILKSYYKKLGLLDQVQIQIPEKGVPLYPKSSEWSDLTLTTMSYGYGISISPLHFIQAMIPVVNGGYKYNLRLVKNDDTNLSDNTTKDDGKQILSKDTSDAMKKLLRFVVSKGAGKKAEVNGYLVGGKTGTANKRVGKAYVNNNRMASFFATMPAIDPKYIILLVLDEPKPTKDSFGFATAGWNAAPAVGNILSRIAALHGMQPYDPSDEEVQEQLNLDYQIDDEI